MRVHHLNCATLCPRGGRLVQGEAPVCGRALLVCHVLVVESRDGLVLVDTGLSEADVLGQRGLMWEGRLRLLAAALDPREPAVTQLAQLGFSPDEVRHVVLTHLDFDHAGGLVDFPRAQVHVLAREHDAALARRAWVERSRYQPVTWGHRPRWALHEPAGAPWFGFEAVREAGGLPPGVLMIPLPGHTRGHAGVAVEADGGWLLHAGDAYFHRDQLDPRDPRCPPGLELFQRLTAVDDRARRHNIERLRALARERAGEVRVFCAHDPVELARLRGA